MCVLIFSITFSEIFFILRRIQGDVTINVRTPSRKVPVSQISMKLEFSAQIFEKYSNIKCYESPSRGSRVVTCGRTDRHNEANSRLSQFSASA